MTNITWVEVFLVWIEERGKSSLKLLDSFRRSCRANSRKKLFIKSLTRPAISKVAGLRSPPARADADCANVPDPPHCRFRVGAAERHDRRHYRRRGHVRRVIAVAVAPSARRSYAARHRHAGVGGSRAGAARPGGSRSVATQRVALYGDRSRVDAATGFPATRRAGGWIIS